MSARSMTVRFWGVRGSIPCPGPDTLRYGGNTSCVEIRCGNRTLIFDAGSGLRALGNEIAKSKTHETDLFLSHCHIDHLIGLPFYTPLFDANHSMRIWCGNAQRAGGLKSAIDRLMSYPLFPIGLADGAATVEYRDFAPGDGLAPHDGIAVNTIALDHPGGATGYRIAYEGKTVAYVTDTETGGAEPDAGLSAFVRGADLLIMDTTYTDAELPAHKGWGHSSWQQAVALAQTAGVRTLCLYHHDPDHNDAEMDQIATAADKARKGTIVAREGLVLDL